MRNDEIKDEATKNTEWIEDFRSHHRAYDDPRHSILDPLRVLHVFVVEIPSRK